MGTQKKNGINEIASHASVSPSAVSSLLRSPNGVGRVSKKTRLHILKACRELNYRPPQPAAYFRVYPELGDYCFVLSSQAGLGFNDPFYAMLLQGVTDALPSKEAHIHLCRFDTLRNYLDSPDEMPAPIRDGVATKILCTGHPNPSFLEELRKRGLSVVYLGREVTTPGVVSITPDFAGGVHSAISHLVRLGHTDIAVAGGSFANSAYNIVRQREAIVESFAAHGLTLRNEFLMYVELGKDGGTLAGRQILEMSKRPTAVYCFNDMIAYGVINECQKGGMKIPDDLSVVGFDHVAVDMIFGPTLTTVHSAVVEMGKTGAELVDKMVLGEEGIPSCISLPTHLVNTEGEPGSITTAKPRETTAP